MIKQCKKCGIPKPLTNEHFQPCNYRDKSKQPKSGFDGVCKVCQKKRRSELTRLDPAEKERRRKDRSPLRDGGKKKKCSRCKKVKRLDRFHPNGAPQFAGGVSGECKDCGRERYLAKYSSPEGRAKQIYNRARTRARNKGLDFDVSIDWVVERLAIGVCELTGIEFDYAEGGSPYAPSLDRINSSMGYTESNCRIICWQLNAALNSFGEGSFEVIARAYLHEKSLTHDNPKSADFDQVEEPRSTMAVQKLSKVR